MDAPRIVVVAQAYKGSLTGSDVSQALRRGVQLAGAEPVVVQGSDGGDGFLDALGPMLVRSERVAASDPLGRPLEARVGWMDEATALVESRLVCGLSVLADGERDPLRTSTRGLGTLIAAVAGRGARRVIVGLGGSATMDGGLGMACAWGWRAWDDRGNPLADGGGALTDLAGLDAGTRPPVEIVALCDVRHRLLGSEGARTFASQKGATPAVADRLARGLQRLVAASAAWGGAEIAERDGAGAAGGLGFGLALFGGAALRAGAPWVLEQAGFDAAVQSAAGVVVGEGAFDGTSLEGKLTGEVIARARAAGVSVLLVAPRATAVPSDVLTETGGGWWTAEDVERRATEGVRRLLRLPRL